MAEKKISIHGIWSSRWTFIMAATGSAVGLGNIWKFPYITGENGGGAFVLVYLLCIALVGIPIMMAEVLLGRQGRQSPINTMRDLVRETGTHKSWQLLGWMGALAGFLILTYYSVIAGWEVKSLREGKVQITESYVLFKDGEAWLFGAQIVPLKTACTHVLADPTRTRKLLLHRRELGRLFAAIQQEGKACVALALYWKGNRVKCEIAIATGKKQHDKRASEKERDWNREKQRIVRHNN